MPRAFCSTCVSLMKLAHENGVPISVISKCANPRGSRSVVSRLVSGARGPDRGGAGRKASIAKRKAIDARRERVEKHLRKPTTTAKVASAIKADLKLAVSEQTVRNDCKATGARALARPFGPLPGKMNKCTRCAWVRRHLELARRAVVVDEKIFTLADNGSRYEWVYEDQERRPRGKGHTPSRNYFGAVGPEGFRFLIAAPVMKDLGPRHCKYDIQKPKKNPKEKRGRPRLHPTQRKANQKKRKGLDGEALIDHVLKPLLRSPAFNELCKQMKPVLVFDNCPVHSNMVKAWLKKQAKGKFEFIFLPEYSPDMSTMENAWAALAYRVSYRDVPMTLEELDRRLHAEFAKMNVKHLSETLGRRWQAVLDSGGRLLSGEWRRKA